MNDAAFHVPTPTARAGALCVVDGAFPVTVLDVDPGAAREQGTHHPQVILGPAPPEAKTV